MDSIYRSSKLEESTNDFFHKIDAIVNPILRELKDPIITTYLVSGTDYSYEKFPMKHLIDEKLFNRMIEYFLDPNNFLLDLFLKHSTSYSEFKQFESRYMDTKLSKREFYNKKKEYLLVQEDSDPEEPMLPDTCSIEEFTHRLSKGDYEFVRFRSRINDGLPIKIPGKKFAMYLNLLKEFNKVDHSLGRILPVERVKVEPTSTPGYDVEKAYYIKYYQKFFPNDYERYDKFQREMNLPYVSEKEYHEILDICFK